MILSLVPGSIWGQVRVRTQRHRQSLARHSSLGEALQCCNRGLARLVARERSAHIRLCFRRIGALATPTPHAPVCERASTPLQREPYLPTYLPCSRSKCPVIVVSPAMCPGVSRHPRTHRCLRLRQPGSRLGREIKIFAIFVRSAAVTDYSTQQLPGAPNSQHFSCHAAIWPISSNRHRDC